MKKIEQHMVLTVLAAFVAFGLAGPSAALAATTPSLGAAATYGVLSDTYINTNVPLPTTINGDVGFTTAPAVVPAGAHANYGSGAPYATAGADQAAALANLNGQPCTFTFVAPAVDLSATAEHSSTYTPGVYCTTGALSIGTNITLDGAGTYIFRSGGALNTVTGSIVTLSGASACDVFWTPNGAVTLNANSTFVGTVIPVSQDITVLSATSWLGRALAFGHVVTTPDASVVITAPTCAAPPPAPPVVPPATGGGIFMPLPLINITKIANPGSLPAGPGPVTYTYTATNIGRVAIQNVWVTDNKCSPVEFVSGDSNANAMLDLTEAWVYRCTKTVAQTETNTVTVHGWSSGWDGYDTADATVVVGLPAVSTPAPVGQVPGTSIPSFPDTGLPPDLNGTPWNVAVLAWWVLMLVSVAMVGLVLGKRAL